MQIVAEETGKGADHAVRLLCVLQFRHPGNGVEGIEEKMRLDLALQKIHAGSLKTLLHLRALHLLFVQLFSEPLILLQSLNVLFGCMFHTVEGVDQFPQLVPVAHLDIRLFQLALRDAAGRGSQLLDRCEDRPGQIAYKAE